MDHTPVRYSAADIYEIIATLYQQLPEACRRQIRCVWTPLIVWMLGQPFVFSPILSQLLMIHRRVIRGFVVLRDIVRGQTMSVFVRSVSLQPGSGDITFHLHIHVDGDLFRRRGVNSFLKGWFDPGWPEESLKLEKRSFSGSQTFIFVMLRFARILRFEFRV